LDFVEAQQPKDSKRQLRHSMPLQPYYFQNC